MITQMSQAIHPVTSIPSKKEGAKENAPSSSASNSPSTKSDWKAVGSPPQQGGLQGILIQTSGGGSGFLPSTTAATAAGAAAATDHPSMSWLHQDYAFPPINRNSAASTASAATTAPAPWANAMTLPTPSSSISASHQTNSLFQQQQQQQINHHQRRSSIIEYPDIASVPMLPEVPAEPLFREYRSMSYSIDASDRDEYYRSFVAPKHLGTFQEEEDGDSLNDDYMMSSAMDDELLAQAQLRSRSKSSAAAFSIWLPSQEESRSWMRFSNQRRSSVAHIPSAYPPSSNNTGFGSSVYSPLPAPSASALSNGDRERLTGLRRFSLSPMPEGNSRLQSPTVPTDPSAFAYLGQRRHSLATPLPQAPNNTATTSIDNLLDSMQALRVHDHRSGAPSQTHDDLSMQFPPENMGKGLILSDIGDDALFCVVEFKRGRSDMYFTTADTVPARNDFVIVEADRGHDLGKVTLDRISRAQLIAMIKQQDTGEDNGGGKKNDVHVKRVLRRASSAEVAMLVSKNQDEAKALLVCQSKIKQKQMPMQVVDAEYQWDKRKLTFYFVADRRVDFRELVRDLFKLYKTRIWMCAVSSGAQ